MRLGLASRPFDPGIPDGELLGTVPGSTLREIERGLRVALGMV